MGVTIRSPKNNIDMGYGGFQRLRLTIAKLCPKEITDHYEYLINNLFRLSRNKVESDLYDKETERLYSKYKNYNKVMNFLYAPDIDAQLSYGTAKQLLKVIGNYDDDVIYGYAGWGDDAARFADFKKILQDCVELKKPLKWN